MTRPRREKQLALPLRTHGGARRGAGRKPAAARPGVAHARRPAVTVHRPVHVTFRAREHVWNLRSRRCFRVIAHGLAMTRGTSPMRVVHFSVQGNHLHLVCEAPSARALAAGVKGLSVRIARGLNRVMGRRGPVFADRYHTHVLRTREEVRRVLAYVLGNFASHARRRGERSPASWVDPYSSAGSPLDVVSPPRTWLLSDGIRRLGDPWVADPGAERPVAN